MDQPILDEGADLLRKLWSSFVPPRIIFLSWRMLQNRIPTIDQLIVRGLVFSDPHLSCPFCSTTLESSQHLFLECEFSRNVWHNVFTWTGIRLELPSSLGHLFFLLRSMFLDKVKRKWRDIFWHATIWVLWTNRNEIVFRNKTVSHFDFPYQIKIISWHWWMYRNGCRPGFTFAAWCFDPWLCILRG
uniref:Reverse transcriptase zinc-binding domain-containing protein n=1 Tax=Cajanus cajan TaxID=3821 RepID=A0A151SLS5_CAJCA|nr:hypothetical protein KK1_001963 [Cajanus cajan]